MSDEDQSSMVCNLFLLSKRLKAEVNTRNISEKESKDYDSFPETDFGSCHVMAMLWQLLLLEVVVRFGDTFGSFYFDSHTFECMSDADAASRLLSLEHDKERMCIHSLGHPVCN